MSEKHFCCDKESAKWGVKKVLMIIGFVILGIALCILMGFVMMWLWNWLMPMIFGLTELTYWQAVGVFVLAKLIFGGFGGGGSDDSGHRKSKRRGPGKTIKSEIKSEFSKEFDKEFDKEWEKEFKKTEASNDDYDELYEKWWEAKGETSFKDYMKSTKSADDTEE